MGSDGRRREIWRALREGDDFAFHVEGFVVVIILVWRGDAVADEDDGGIHSSVGIGWSGRDGVVNVRCERERRNVASDGEGGSFCGGAERAEGDGLEVGVGVAGGLEAHAFETSGHVFGGEFVAARGGAAAFESVIGEEAHVGADGVGGSWWKWRGGRRGRRGA